MNSKSSVLKSFFILLLTVAISSSTAIAQESSNGGNIECQGDLWYTRLIDYTNPNTGEKATFFVHPGDRENPIYRQWISPSCNTDLITNRCRTNQWQDIEI